MKIKAYATMQLRKTVTDSGFSEDELTRISEITGISRTVVVAGVFKFEGVVVNEYFDSPIVVNLMTLLQDEMGRSICFYNTPLEQRWKKDSVLLELRKEFSAVDYKKANFFRLAPSKEIGRLDPQKYWADEVGCPFPLKKSSITKHRIGNINNSGHQFRVFCDQGLYLEMIAENFVGIDFAECELTGSSKKDIQIYELLSSVILPQSSNDFVGERSWPLTGYVHEESCHISDASTPALLSYTTDTLKSFPDFDVALTYEKFGAAIPEKNPSKYRFPMVVVSRKFREWCLERKLKLHFHPIKEA